MGIWDKMKKAGKSIANALGFGKEQGTELPAPSEAPSESNRSRWLWVSKEIPEDAAFAYRLAAFMGGRRGHKVRKQADQIMARAPGFTLNAGINQTKRAADAMGHNNKARRRNRSALRAAMKADLACAVAHG